MEQLSRRFTRSHLVWAFDVPFCIARLRTQDAERRRASGSTGHPPEPVRRKRLEGSFVVILLSRKIYIHTCQSLCPVDRIRQAPVAGPASTRRCNGATLNLGIDPQGSVRHSPSDLRPTSSSGCGVIRLRLCRLRRHAIFVLGWLCTYHRPEPRF